ncbi:MAG: hypothetical protein K0U98_04435 [Deltaproteobacteria bacterium]|nr:hypothetical protein [Deltaproteobacteria bacterium]
MRSLNLNSWKWSVCGLALGALVAAGMWAQPTSADDSSAAEGVEDQKQVQVETKTEEEGVPVVSLESMLNNGPAWKAGCRSMVCENTGTKVGTGANCAAAEANLISQLNAAAYQICPDIVIGLTNIHVGTCDLETCDTPGNADVVCKICPGQFCA